ncbi:X-Pro dipeptidyl-peptidase, partial [bacterium]|nr:X-Pro dipeptidyl-peptidase [bacterium]
MKIFKKHSLQWFALIGIILFIESNFVFAQESFDIRANYTKTEHMIPVRDGVKLFTQVYTPKDQSQKYPFLLFRTPYSARYYGADNYRSVLGTNKSYAEEGFIFVYQDVRGKFKSEGEFVVMKPHKT